MLCEFSNWLMSTEDISRTVVLLEDVLYDVLDAVLRGVGGLEVGPAQRVQDALLQVLFVVHLDLRLCVNRVPFTGRFWKQSK